MRATDDATAEAEFQAFYRRTVGLVTGRARAILRSAAEAMDVTQEVYFEAWRAWPKVRAHPTPIGWLMAATTHRAIDRVRHQAIVAKNAVAERRVAEVAVSPTREVELALLLETVLRDEGELLQRVVAHVLLDGTTQEETALLLEVSRKTVQRHLDRFRAKCEALFPEGRINDHVRA